VRRAAYQQIVEIHAPRRPGDAHTAAFPLPAPSGLLRCCLAWIVSICKHDYLAHFARQIELRRPEVESAAQTGLPVANMAARQLSMPSPIINGRPLTSSLVVEFRVDPQRRTAV
jgi:hypothetical protein